MMIVMSNTKKMFEIDDEDYQRLMEACNYGKFCLNGYGYAQFINKITGLLQCVHKFLLNAPRKKQVDHINHNKLDNKKCNLRVCTSAENKINRRKRNGEYTSKYKGVSRDLRRPKSWVTQINVGGKSYLGGSFNTELEAAAKANELMLLHHGEFANLNII